MALKILAVNPGSTSTKVAIYEDGRECWKKGVTHRPEDIARLKRMQDQLELRSAAVRSGLAEAGIPLSDLSAVVGRGGLLKPLAGGVYEVNEQMKADLIAVDGNPLKNIRALLSIALVVKSGKEFLSRGIDHVDVVEQASGMS